MKMVYTVFAHSGTLRVDQVTALAECRCAHTPLHTLDKTDVFGLQYGVYKVYGLLFRVRRLCALKEKVEFLVGLIRRDRYKSPDHEVAPARVTEQCRVGPQIPDRMIGYARTVDSIGLVSAASCLGHVAGINAVGSDLVGVHLHQGHEILVGDGAVITLQKIIQHYFPVGFELVGQAVGKREIAKVGGVGKDFFSQISGLLPERSGTGIEVDEDQVMERLHLDRHQVDIGFAEIFDEFAAPRPAQGSVKIVDPGVVGTGDGVDLSLTAE